jgi:hypothetical protein
LDLWEAALDLPDSGLDPEVGLHELGKEAVCATAERQKFLNI